MDLETTALLTPVGGTPEVITTEAELQRAIQELSKGSGPFAIDAERASGYKYSSRAYLIQIKRLNGGLHLIDPIPFQLAIQPGIQPASTHPLFANLNDLLRTDEVILHASTQDLPCLREVGLNPTRLFDTELAGRIAGLPRVGLGPLVESLLGITLAKEHSAVDWSIRPLPIAWLTYAALDVELLLELRKEIGAILIAQGKSEWADEEFSAILNAPPSEKRRDPWRRTSGMHKVKKRNVLAVIKSLWTLRDELAREVDVSSSKLLSDAALMELAIHLPKTRKEMEKLLRPIGARARWFERSEQWLDAIELAAALPESEWPELRAHPESAPPVKIWREKFPQKYAPLTHARAAIELASEQLAIPAENLISPELVRRIIWEPPPGATASLDIVGVEKALIERGARRWQSTIAAPLLAAALLEKVALPPVETASDPAVEGELRNT
jgi:ribonuclease D